MNRQFFFAMCMSCCICAKSIWYIVLRINEWYDAPIYIGWDGMWKSYVSASASEWVHFCLFYAFRSKYSFRFYRFHLMLMETLLYSQPPTRTHIHVHASCSMCISFAREACHNSLAAIFNNRAHSIRATAPICWFSFEISLHWAGCVYVFVWDISQQSAVDAHTPNDESERTREREKLWAGFIHGWIVLMIFCHLERTQQMCRIV